MWPGKRADAAMLLTMLRRKLHVDQPPDLSDFGFVPKLPITARRYILYIYIYFLFTYYIYIYIHIHTYIHWNIRVNLLRLLLFTSQQPKRILGGRLGSRFDLRNHCTWGTGRKSQPKSRTHTICNLCFLVVFSVFAFFLGTFGCHSICLELAKVLGPNHDRNSSYDHGGSCRGQG